MTAIDVRPAAASTAGGAPSRIMRPKARHSSTSASPMTLAGSASGTSLQAPPRPRRTPFAGSSASTPCVPTISMPPTGAPSR
jgi:hypothetical protein